MKTLKDYLKEVKSEEVSYRFKHSTTIHRQKKSVLINNDLSERLKVRGYDGVNNCIVIY